MPITAAPLTASGPYDPRFLVVHALLVPGAFGIAAFVAATSGLDQAIAAAFFDSAAAAFPARGSAMLEVIGHRFAKSAVLLAWILIAAAALAARFLPAVAIHRRALWSTAFAMMLGPTLVVLLKALNSHHCPWSLRGFGGTAEFSAAWFVPAAEAAHCFPSGHAAAGFSLIAVSFAATAAGNHRLARVGLVVALAAGFLFSGVRIAQGAHFLSHNLWSAAIDWLAAALVFLPLVGRGERLPLA